MVWSGCMFICGTAISKYNGDDQKLFKELEVSIRRAIETLEWEIRRSSFILPFGTCSSEILSEYQQNIQALY